VSMNLIDVCTTTMVGVKEFEGLDKATRGGGGEWEPMKIP
jgi:hypothetical protein